MSLFRQQRFSRKDFLKGLAIAAVWASDFPLAYTGNITLKSDSDKSYLAAACGTFCGACPAYLARHGEDEQMRQKRLSPEPKKAQNGIPPSDWMKGLLCDGCLSGGQLAGHCLRCNIRLHALEKQKDGRCAGCEDLPCNRILSLIGMGNYLHRKEYLPNLGKIQIMGVSEWVKYEEERWRCPQCRNQMSWYDSECIRCGSPRSDRLFPLT